MRHSWEVKGPVPWSKGEVTTYSVCRRCGLEYRLRARKPKRPTPWTSLVTDDFYFDGTTEHKKAPACKESAR